MGQALLSTNIKQRKNDHQIHSKVSETLQSILKQSFLFISRVAFPGEYNRGKIDT